MKKSHRDAFDKALLNVVKYSKDRQLILNKKTNRYDMVVPVTTVIRSFKRFTDLVRKDLKLGVKNKNERNSRKYCKS